MNTPTETVHKSPPRISEWAGMKAIMTSIAGLGLLQLTTVLKPELNLPVAIAAFAAFAIGLVGLRKPLDPANFPKAD